jgi:hypothetical protein
LLFRVVRVREMQKRYSVATATGSTCSEEDTEPVARVDRSNSNTPPVRTDHGTALQQEGIPQGQENHA